MNEHAPYRASLAVQEEFTVPFGLVLGASVAQVGVLATVPRLAAALIQLVTPYLLARSSSRRVIVGSALLGALSFAGAGSVVFMPESLRVWALLFWSVLSMLLLELPQPAWGAWLSNLVPENRRGRYIALRFGVGIPAALGVFLVGGLFLDASTGWALLGFTSVFMAGAGLRLLSAWMLRHLYEPARPRSAPRPIRLRSAVRQLPDTPLGRFMLLSFFLNVTTWISAPYIAVYELQVLGFSYIAYMALVGVHMLVVVAGMRFWGPFADRRGNYAGIRIAVIGIAFLPLMWIPVQAPIHAIPAQVVGGMVWGCMMLCGLNYVYRESMRESRATNVALYNALNGVGIFIGAMIGGALQPHLGSIAGLHPFATLLTLSAVLRGVAAVGFWTLVEDRRKAPVSPAPKPAAPPLSAAAAMPAVPTTHARTAA